MRLLTWLRKQPQEIFFILGGALVYILLLPLVPIFDGDTFYYINHARQILERQDWLNTSTMMAKPVLVLWLAALIYKVFSVSIFSTYLWHTLFVFGSLWALYGFVRENFNVQVARLSSLVLGTALMFFYQSLSPMLDIPLMFFLILSQRYLFRFLLTGRVRWALVTGVFLGLGFLTKGFIGLAIPLTTAGVYLLAQKRSPWEVSPRFGRAVLGLSLVVLLVSSIWLIPQFAVYGQQFGQLLYRENIERFFHPIDETGGARQVSSATQRDPHLNILYLFLGFLPWSPLIVPALWQVYKDKYFGKKDINIFLLSWFWVYLLLSSLSGHYKGPRYLLPLFPPLAIIVGAYLDTWLVHQKRSFQRTIVWGYALCTAVFILLITYVLATHFPHGEDQYKPVVIPILLLLGSTYGLSWYFWKEQLKTGFAYIIGSLMVAYTGMLIVALVALPKILPEIAVAKYCRQKQLTPVVWQMKIRALDIYIGKTLRYISQETELNTLPKGTILLCQDKDLVQIERHWQIVKQDNINEWSVVVLLRPVRL